MDQIINIKQILNPSGSSFLVSKSYYSVFELANDSYDAISAASGDKMYVYNEFTIE